MTMHYFRLAYALLLGFLLTACSAVGPKFSEVKTAESSIGVIYVYRLPNFAGGGSSPLLFIDGAEVTSLKNGGHVRRTLLPGRHVIELRNGSIFTKMKPLAIDVTIEAGVTHFLRYSIEQLGSRRVAGVFVHDFGRSFELVGSDTAQGELKETSEIR